MRSTAQTKAATTAMHTSQVKTDKHPRAERAPVQFKAIATCLHCCCAGMTEGYARARRRWQASRCIDLTRIAFQGSLQVERLGTPDQRQVGLGRSMLSLLLFANGQLPQLQGDGRLDQHLLVTGKQYVSGCNLVVLPGVSQSPVRYWRNVLGKLQVCCQSALPLPPAPRSTFSHQHCVLTATLLCSVFSCANYRCRLGTHQYFSNFACT